MWTLGILMPRHCPLCLLVLRFLDLKQTDLKQTWTQPATLLHQGTVNRAQASFPARTLAPPLYRGGEETESPFWLWGPAGLPLPLLQVMKPWRSSYLGGPAAEGRMWKPSSRPVEVVVMAQAPPPPREGA